PLLARLSLPHLSLTEDSLFVRRIASVTSHFSHSPRSSSAHISLACDAARLVLPTQRRKESREIPPPFPPFDGCQPTQAPLTLLFRTPLMILLQTYAGG